MSSEKCNDAVYKHGEHVGTFAWSKAEAESYRKKATDKKWLYDWHFVGGRVVMLRIRRGLLPAIGRALNALSRRFK